MRKCRSCNRQLEESAFKPLASAPDGLSKTCIECLARERERGKAYAKAHPEIERARRQRNRAKNLEHELAYARRRYAEERARVKAKPYRCAAHHAGHEPPVGFKTCPLCGWDLPLSEFENDRYKRCRVCRAKNAAIVRDRYDREGRRRHYLANREEKLALNRQWRIEHPERVRLLSKKWRKEHPEYRREVKRRYYGAHPEKKREAVKRSHRRTRANLSDGYVRSVLTEGSALRAADIPNELVELKRCQLKIHRLLRGQRNE